MSKLSHPVCAGVTVLSFRRNLDELSDEFWKNAEDSYANTLDNNGIDPSGLTDEEWKSGVTDLYIKAPQSDLQVLLSRPQRCSWSAPKQDLLDGALFFYLGKRALTNVQRCVRQAKNEDWIQDTPFMASLQEMEQFIECHAGSVVGVAKVLSIPGEGSGLGFRRRVFAVIDSKNFHRFENPLPYERFQKICPIHGQTVSALVSEKANRLRDELGETNELPSWLTNMTFGESKYADIGPENWMERISAPHIFIEDNHKQEETIRAYFLNYVINEVKDEGTFYYVECNTWRNGRRTGIADYFFKIHGEWVPFEAKVAVNTEVDIYAQVRQYIDVDHFDYEVISDDSGSSPRKQAQRVGKHKLCLIGDQFGIYLTRDGAFVNCSPDKPLWARTELSKPIIAEIRETLREMIKA